jgi:hypothetical protein
VSSAKANDFARLDLTVTLPRAQAAMHTTTIRCDEQEFAPLHLLLTVEGERRVVGVVAVPLTSTTSLRVPEGRLLNAITASLYLAAPSTSDDT